MNISNKTIKLSFILAILIMASFYIYQSFADSFKVNKSAVNNLTSGLVGYWTFDGADINTTTATDKSPAGGHGGILNGSPVPSIGKIGQALNFNGTSSYINQSSSDFALTGNFAVSAWFKADSGSMGSSETLISKRDNQDNWNNGYAIYFKDGNINFFVAWSELFVASKSFTNDGNWHHVVGINDYSNSKIKIYVDGVKGTDYDIALNPTYTLPADLMIGSSMNGASGPSYFFGGQIDETRVYNRALSQSEITELYQQGQTKINASQTGKLTNGLVSYWTFDGPNTNSTTATDVVSGYSGALTSTTPAIGKIGQALDFNGSPSTVTVNGAASPNLNITSAVTVSAWIKPKITGTVTVREIATKGNANRGYRMVFEDFSDTYCGTYGVAFRFGNSNMICSDSENILTYNQWNHVVATADTTTIKIYVDNVLKKTATGTYTVDDNLNDNLLIGSGSSGFFNGSMDEVRIYNKVLSASEITELYQQGQTKINASQTGKLTNGLTHYYTFDGPDMSGDTVYDKVSSGTIDGALQNCGLDSPSKPVRTIGKIGQGLSIVTNSEDDCVALASPITTGTTYSMSMWMKPDNDAAGFLFGAGNQNSIKYTTGGRINFQYSSSPHYSNNNLISIRNWNHVMVVVNSATATFYINGVADGTAASVPTLGFGNIGGAGGQYSFSGSIDEVRFYNRALSQSEVTELYNMGR
jgi:hypothetical protein